MKLKHCFRRAAAAVMCLMLFCSVAGAAEPTPGPAPVQRPSYKQLTQDQLKAECSLSLSYKDGDTVLPETEFRLYQVAGMDQNIRLTPTEQFAGYPVFRMDSEGYIDINEQGFNDWGSVAATLAGYVARDAASLAPTATAKSDAAGVVKFEKLPVGVYLMVGERTSQNGNYYDPSSALLTLPSWLGNDWVFNPTDGAVKFTSRPIEGGGGGGTTSVHVLKAWEDEGYEDSRPSGITVQLLRNGEVYRTTTLNASNNWRYTWDNLDRNDQWQVVEDTSSDQYQVSVSLEGSTYLITNTYQEEIEDPDTPTTDMPDDPNNPGNSGAPDDPGDVEIDDPDVPLSGLPQTGQLWWPVPLLAAAGVVLMGIGVKRRQEG